MKRALCCILIACLLAGCARHTGPTRYQATFLDLFDTVTLITGYADSHADFLAQAQALHASLAEYHRLFDIYNTYPGLNNLCTVNAAGGAAVAVDQRLLDLLRFAREVYDLTGGAVNAAMGSVLQLWHDAREAGLADPANAALPAEAALREAAAHMELSCMELDSDAGTVRLTDPALRLDVGALAKGYAVEQVARQAASDGLSGYLLSVGGNVRAIGANSNDTDFVIGLENPDGSGSYLHRVGIRDAAVVTSGSYQRYYTVAGRRYCHIISPETLFPADRYASVAIVCPDSGLADALSTALFLLSPEDGQALLSRVEGAQALWVYPDGTELSSPGLSKVLID